MPRKPRIEIAGYYHIINRGVEQRVVFNEEEDYEYFIELLCFQAKSYGITIHNYCLMSNHYHLLTYTLHRTKPTQSPYGKCSRRVPLQFGSSFLDKNSEDKCLQDAWITQNYQDDLEAIKDFLDSSVDTGELEKLRKASSLVEASHSDKKPDSEKLKKMLSKAKETKERNKLILKAYSQGYSQHMIAKVLGLAQSTVNGIIKRTKRDDTITFT